MTQKSKTALYAGSFNPFTIGHRDIAIRALQLCDRLIIAIGVNPDKCNCNVEKNLEAIRNAMKEYPQVEVTTYSGLTVDFACKNNVDFLVRGVRAVADFEAERNLADINREIANIDTILLPARPELAFVSSSMVRELEANGFDADKYKA